MTWERKHRRRKIAGLTCGQMSLVFLLVVLVALGAALAFGYRLGLFERFIPTDPSPENAPMVGALTETPVPERTVQDPQKPAHTPTQALQPFLTPTATISVPLVISPTVTLATTLTPPIGICEQLDLRFINATSTVAAWRVQNSSGVPQIISRIEMEWPSTNDAIFNAFLDGAAIWSGVDQVSPTFVTSWIGDESDRRVNSLSRLEFFFGTAAASSGYNLTLRFENGCEVSHTH